MIVDAPEPRLQRARVRHAVIGLMLIAAQTLAPAMRATDGGRIAGQVRAGVINISLELSAPSVELGQKLQARATVRNLSSLTVRLIAVELRVEPSGVRVTKPDATVAQLKGGRSVTVAWSLCGRSPGTFVVLARATLDGVAFDSPARLLAVTSGAHRAC